MKKVVVGVGNPIKSDDNIGNLIVDELSKIEEIEFIKAESNPENFIGKIQKINPGIIFFIDAVVFDGKIGEVRKFDVKDVLEFSVSTHNFSLDVFQNMFPKSKIVLIGIKPEKVEYGQDLSASLEREFSNIVEKVKSYIA